MQGDAAVIEALNDILTAELTAINQYFVHAKMCENWGYGKLYQKFRAQAIDEMKDVDEIIERILYLDGVPNMQRLFPIAVGQNPREQLELALETEKVAIDRLNKAVSLCTDKGDNGSRELVEEVLKGEEEHADWLEAQLHLMDEVGVAGYLAEQIHG